MKNTLCLSLSKPTPNPMNLRVCSVHTRSLHGHHPEHTRTLHGAETDLLRTWYGGRADWSQLKNGLEKGKNTSATPEHFIKINRTTEI